MRVFPNYKQGIACTIDLICLMKFVCIPSIQKREFALWQLPTTGCKTTWRAFCPLS